MVLTPLCASLVGALVAVIKTHKEKSQRDDERFSMEHKLLLDGMKATMRSELFSIHRQYVQAGEPVPIDVKEHATSVYNVYSGLGGNGTGTHLYKEIMATRVSR